MMLGSRIILILILIVDRTLRRGDLENLVELFGQKIVILRQLFVLRFKLRDLRPEIRDFQLQLPPGMAKFLWPDAACLFSVDIRKDIACVRRLLVWQGEGFLVCAVCESTPRIDVIAGNFFSGNDPFALDQQSEIHAISYHKLARRMVVQASVDVLAPMASYDLGMDLGKALADKLTTASAEKFLDGLVASLLSRVKPSKH